MVRNSLSYSSDRSLLVPSAQIRVANNSFYEKTLTQKSLRDFIRSLKKLKYYTQTKADGINSPLVDFNFINWECYLLMRKTPSRIGKRVLWRSVRL